ncbi:MAG: hypothetical protein K8W52_13930 [Deltaproteobacteria bacterium]|nr:hypothetical protein [Deltaproteobacteria bacterium]
MSNGRAAFLAVVLATMTVATRDAAADHVRRFGVMTDLGVPDGGVASLVYRPVGPIRLNAGIGSNLISTGLRAGVTIVPLPWWFSPSVSLDVGRYPEGDANMIARIALQDPTYSSAMLDRVGYDYVDAHVGFEFGRAWATFYIHGGVSRTTGLIHGLSDPQKGVTFTEDPRVTSWTPSVRVGLIVYAFN